MIVTVEPDAVTPRIQIVTSGSTVYRVLDGVRTKVRGDVEADVIYDYECPQETAVTYVAAEPGGEAESDPVEMPEIGVWLIHLSTPELSRRLTVSKHEGWESSATTSVLEIPGGEAHAVTFGRQSDSASFLVKLWSREEFDGFRALVDDGSVLFMNAPYAFGTGCIYVALGGVSWDRVGQRMGSQLRFASFSYKVVRRPEVVISTTSTIDSLTGTINQLVGTIDSLGD